MKKIIVLVLALFLGFCFNNGTVYSAEQGYISVDATSELEIVPDIVDFSVEIVTTSKDSMTKAVEENKKISAKVYEDLKNAIAKNPSDSISTSDYSATPVYRYYNNKRVLDYYQVRNSVKIHTKDTANIGKMIEIATIDGATSVNSMSYSVSSNDEQSNKLLAETAQKARTQGDKIAKAMGTEITGIKSISSSCSFSSKNVMQNRMLMGKAVSASMDEAAGADNGVNIEIGKMTLHARVHADFYVK